MHLMSSSKLNSTRIGGQRLEYRVRYSRAAKRRRIQVGPAGVTVLLPQGQSLTDAARLLKQNAEWVKSQVEAVARLVHVRRNLRSALLLAGKELRLIVRRSEEGRARVILGDGEIEVQVPPGAEPSKVLERWMRRRARHVFADAVARRSTQMKVRPR